MMRISGGTVKGRKVGSRRLFTRRTRGDEVRPTGAKVREAIFNILRDRIGDALFLDLYAGSGAVGIEALSRGAAKVVFVEAEPDRASMIREHLTRFNFEASSEVIRERAADFMREAAVPGRQYDIIFLDPPYASDELSVVLPLIGRGDALKATGVVLAEHSAKRQLPEQVNGLRAKKTYRYGDTAMTLYTREEL